MNVPTVTVANCGNEFSQQTGTLLTNDSAPKTAVEKPVASFENRAELNQRLSDNPQPTAQPWNEQSVSQRILEASIPAAPAQLQKSVGKYRLLRTIGKGNFAKVKLAVHIATGVEVAIKIVNKTTLDGQLLKRLKREMNIMKNTNHPNIVKLLEVIENEDVMCLVMEYASGGEIFDYLVAHGRVKEKEARVKFRQLLSAIQYCHSKRIVHRDLKAENILLDPKLNVKVADFGLANTFEADQRLHTFCGSPPYAAPELFLGVPYYGPGVDIWSLGVLLFTLVIGHLPFDARDLRELRSKIIGLNYTIPKGVISAECEALLRKMLVLDPKDRSSLKALMQDKWVNISYEHDVLRPYKEPQHTALDEDRVKIMESMGYTRAQLEASVLNPEFDHAYATYHLLPEANSMVCAIYADVIKLRKLEHGAGVSSPPSSVSEKPTTEIGRFTVAPSSTLPESSPQQQQPTSRPRTDAVSATADPHPKPALETALREHHSLTSTLPVALRRAFAQMGRTLVGTSGAQASVTAGYVAEASTRTFNQAASGRVSMKSAPRANGGRHVITAAPVPIITTKKSQLASAHSKRGSPGPLPSIALHDNRTATIESSSTPTAVSSLKSHATPPSTTIATHAASVSRPDSAKKTPKSSPSTHSQRSNQSRSAQVPMTSVAKDSPQRITPLVSQVDNEKSLQNSVATPAQPGLKSVASSSTSSDSQSEAPSRRRSVSSVQDVWLTTNSPKTSGQTENIVPSAGLLSVSPLVGPAHSIDQSAKQSGAMETLTPSPVIAFSPHGEGHSAIEKNTPKSSHTVQGNEAKALQEVLRIQAETIDRPVISTSDANAHTLDGSHTNTWGRGVLKALGGLFGPMKPQESLPSGRVSVGPRVVRFPSSVNTTSSKTAEDLLSCVVIALESTQGCRYAYNAQMPFLLRCSWANNRGALRPVSGTDPVETPAPVAMFGGSSHCGERDDPLHFEMEVCQLPRLHLRGVRVKRIRGSAIQFREVADSIMKALRL